MSCPYVEKMVKRWLTKKWVVEAKGLNHLVIRLGHSPIIYTFADAVKTANVLGTRFAPYDPWAYSAIDFNDHLGLVIGHLLPSGYCGYCDECVHHGQPGAFTPPPPKQTTPEEKNAARAAVIAMGFDPDGDSLFEAMHPDD